MKKIQIKLSPEEVDFLKEFKEQKGRTLRQINRANILLLCDKGKAEKDIAEFLDVGTNTIWRIKKRYLKKGLEAALGEEPRPGRPPLFDTNHEAGLTAIACSDAPKESERWTLELLTGKMRKEVKGCKGISKETVRLMLKKTGLNPGERKCGASGR